MAWNWINESGEIDFVFMDFSEDIKEVVNIVTLDISSGNYTATATVIQAVFQVVYVIGLNLAVLFFLLSFLKKTMMFEFVTMEAVVKTILLLFVTDFFLENCDDVLNGVYQGLTWAVKQVNETVALDAEFSDAIKKVIALLKDTLQQRQSTFNPIDNLTFNLRFLPIWVIMMGTKVLVWAIAYGRIIEIYIHQCIAPIPLSTMVSEDLSHVAMKFMKSYVGVCLQGLVILVLCYIYQGLMLNWLVSSLDANGGNGDINMGLGGLIVCNLAFGLAMWKSGEWAKRITGAM